MISLDVMKHVDLQTPLCGPDVHAIVSHGRRAQEFLLQFEFARQFHQAI